MFYNRRLVLFVKQIIHDKNIRRYKMKKALSVLLAAFLVFALFACSKTTEPAASPEQSNAGATAGTPQESTQPQGVAGRHRSRRCLRRALLQM